MHFKGDFARLFLIGEPQYLMHAYGLAWLIRIGEPYAF